MLPWRPLLEKREKGRTPFVSGLIPTHPSYTWPRRNVATRRFLLARMGDEAVIVAIDVEVVADNGTAIVDVGSNCRRGARKGDGSVPATLQKEAVSYAVTYAVEFAYDTEGLVHATSANIDAAGNLIALKVAARCSKIAGVGVEADDFAFVGYLVSIGKIGARKI